VAGKRRRKELIQRRAHAYSTERIDNPTIRSNTPGRIGRNKPTPPSISSTQPAAINARRFNIAYWMQPDRGSICQPSKFIGWHNKARDGALLRVPGALTSKESHYGSIACLMVAFTWMARRLEESHPPPRAFTRLTEVTRRWPRICVARRCVSRRFCSALITSR
jgi:hypothetical protein